MTATSEHADIVIVGTGHGAAQAAIALRQRGHGDRIVMLGRAQAPPNARQPLSKEYLAGDKPFERILIRPEKFWADKDIELRLGAAVTEIDAGAHKVTLSDGATLTYRKLIWAGGGDPRRLSCPGAALKGVFYVRDKRDADAMMAALEAGAKRAVVIGGVYIGLEAASVASMLGLDVVLVEMADRILQRVAAPETSDYFRTLHTDHGVDIREGVGLSRLTGDGAVTGAELSDGSTLDVDFVIVGVGIAPGTALAEAAGVDIDNGIKTDAQGRTSVPHVWAAGDCASFPYRDTRIRLESVPNAIDQAECVAENIMGAARAYVARPWFWSDQYDVKLQIAGLNTGYDRVVTRDGGAAKSFWYYQGDTLLAVDAANDPRGYMIGKRLIEAGKTADPAVEADPKGDLKALLK